MSVAPPTEEAVAAATSPEKPPQPSEPAPSSESPATESKELVAPSTLLPPAPSPPPITTTTTTTTISIPSYSSWFSFDNIHETERRFLSEFFINPRSPSKDPRVYKYYRDAIIRKFREDPLRKITYTEVRRTLVGDVGSIRRVFDFLESWGLINYSGVVVKPNLKAEEKVKEKEKEKESKTGVSGLLPPPLDSPLEKKESAKKVCGGCKSVCSLACFACDKADLILCARCFVRGNYQLGLNSGDFKRVDISEETKTNWTEKETLHLLEAILQFGNDWKKVAEHVGGRSEKECVARFIKLPFREQFMGTSDIDEVDKYYHKKDQLNAERVEISAISSPAKRRCLTPLADASNPIMAQAAFLSAIVGSDVAKSAAQAAVAALSEVSFNVQAENNEEIRPLSIEIDQREALNANGQTTAEVLEAAMSEVHARIEKEEQELENSIFEIIDVQMREIQEKIVRFENMEMQMEKEWLQLHNIRSQLFNDQLTVLQHKAPTKFAESGEEKTKTLDSIP
ncbi:hypothetical protein MRB53_024559 [Persea americana]|uniref:Uncharacterized protein n=1 Tax=Persea americana TaxID=3435 RepID=A0ACC2LDE9_PERAE|nr:hypothetical protein MRB53_024559 [Persea americana]